LPCSATDRAPRRAPETPPEHDDSSRAYLPRLEAIFYADQTPKPILSPCIPSWSLRCPEVARSSSKFTTSAPSPEIAPQNPSCQVSSSPIRSRPSDLHRAAQTEHLTEIVWANPMRLINIRSNGAQIGST
jgi:hypothetical protein